jgi:hypothetical protein
MPNFCPSCGKELPHKNPETCPQCGAKIQTPLPAPAEIRDPWVAVILSFLFPGWGQWYTGKTVDGLKFFLAYLIVGIISLVLFWTGVITPSLSYLIGLACILIIILLGIWIYGMYDTYKTAEKMNRGELAFTGKSGLFWLPIILIIIVPILLIASAFVSALVFGMADVASHNTKEVAVTAIRPNADHIVVTYYGGRDASYLQSITISDNGVNAGVMNIPAGSGLTSLPVGTNTTISAPYRTSNHINVVGHFTDGSTQVLLDISM